MGITNCKIIISIWKTYTLTILFQNSNCDIVIKPFLRSENNETIFLYWCSLRTFYVGTWYVYHNFLPFTKPSDKAFITRSSTWGWKNESYNKIMAKRGQTNIHNTVQIICSYKWKKVLRQYRYMTNWLTCICTFICTMYL